MPVFDTAAYESMALGQANEAITLASDSPEVAQVHATLAVAYAQLADMMMRLALSNTLST